MHSRISHLDLSFVHRLIAALVIPVLFGGCGSQPSEKELLTRYPNAKIYSSWQAFISNDAWEKHEKRPVVFIGMDGVTWRILDPMIDAGDLPTFKRLKEEGAYGVLRSTECFVSPPAWTTMMTGVLPNKGGVYTFGTWDDDTQEFGTVSSEDVVVPTVWDIASVAGLNTAVINYPVTYPAQNVNGILVSGMLTPIMLDDRRPKFTVKFEPYEGKLTEAVQATSYSPVLYAQLNVYSNVVIFLLYDTTDDNTENYDLGIVAVVRRKDASREDGQVPSHYFKLDQYSPWLNIDFLVERKAREAWIQVKVATDNLPQCDVRFSAVYFTPDDPEIHYTYPKDFKYVIAREFDYYFPYTPFDRAQIPEYVRDAARYASFFYKYDAWDLFYYVFMSPDHMQHVEGDSPNTQQVYKTIDEFLEWLLSQLPENASLVIASDHGFKPYVYALDLNVFLADLGLLEWKEEEEGEAIEEEEEKKVHIDFEKTLVHYNMWNLYFNHALLSQEELEKRAVESRPGESPKEALIRYLQEKGRALSDPGTGKSIPVEFTPYPEPSVSRAPDLIVTGGYDDYLVEFWDRKNPHTTIMRELADDECWDHEREGIFFVKGEGVREGYNAGVKNIQDVAPTMLFMLGLPLSANLDGVVMSDIFSEQAVADHPIVLVRKYDDITKTSTMSMDERENLEKKLKSLGYIR